MIRAAGPQVLAFETGKWTDPRYPNSLMGAIALTRQTLFDAQWHRDAWTAWETGTDGAARPEENASLRALGALIDGRRAVFMESG